MGVKEKIVKVREVNYECDFCNEGIMKAETEEGFNIYKKGAPLSNGPEILHKCTECGVFKYLDREYPFRKYNVIGA